MENISKERQAALLEQAKSVPGLEKTLRGMTEDEIIARDLVDLKINADKRAAVFILDEKFDKSLVRRIVIGAYCEGSINYREPVEYQSNPEKRYSKITEMKVEKYTYSEISFKAVSESSRISGSFMLSR